MKALSGSGAVCQGVRLNLSTLLAVCSKPVLWQKLQLDGLSLSGHPPSSFASAFSSP
jgi:hypothetical protein